MIIVQEIQTNNGQTALLPPQTFADRLAADSAFHMMLASAAISSVNYHTVMMFDELGNVIRKEFYEHPTTAVEPEVYVEE